MMFFKKNANRDHDGDRKSALDVVVSGSNLLCFLAEQVSINVLPWYTE